MLADKVSGDLAGIWLLVAEHLRLGTWDLLCGWTGQSTARVEPRLALQLLHEAAVCTAGIRAERTLHSRGGFELANGLPFVASDPAMHELLDAHPIADSRRLQLALGKLRRASGHFVGKLLAIDPDRVQSYSKRRMQQRAETGAEAQKRAQTFWLLDVDTHQPVCFTTATTSQSVVAATPELLLLASEILSPEPGASLVLADAEHFAGELIDDVHLRTRFELLVPIPNRPAFRRKMAALPAEQFHRRWAGFATAKLPYAMHNCRGPRGTYWQFIERYGECPDTWRFKGFLSTTDRDEVDTLTVDFPKRWHVEEFFNAHQALGWHRAGTMNLHIRYGQMTLALLAQAVIYQLRQRLGAPYASWDANHLARDLFFALEGDVRVTDDTILVTYYNAPDTPQLRAAYEHLPEKLRRENVAPEIPWLYNYKLDFRFR
jgi:hypothetical protein